MMKLKVDIELEVKFTEKESLEFKKLIEEYDTEIEEYVKEQLTKILTHEADIPEESIKKLVVKEVTE
jgi:hypothetical protein